MTKTAPRNRYGMGTAEQVLEFETWLRSEPDRFLLACLMRPASDEERAFIESVLRERPRSGAERAVLESLIEDRRPASPAP
jgi:hypothetical protein